MSLALLAPLYLGLHLASEPPELTAVPGPPESTEPAATSPSEGEPPPPDGPAAEVPTQPSTEAGSTQEPTSEEVTAEPTTEPTTPPPAEPCPCDDLDWRCRQQHEAQCTSDTPAPSIKQVEPYDAELPTPLTPAEPELRGVVLELGAGVGGYCSRGSCTPLKEVVENNGDDPVSRRQMRQRFPRPWALTVEFRRRF